jgi:hypothetical protein
MSEYRSKTKERLHPADKASAKKDETQPSVSDRERAYGRIGQGWSAWGTTLVI